MWLPRALDVARIAAVCQAAGPRVVDVGAGTGLLARMLQNEGVAVVATDPHPPPVRYVVVAAADAASLTSCDVALVSWMEAGKDYRDAVARAAPVIVNVYDVEGGCGVMGAVDFPGYMEAASWRTASFEDAQFALERRGRGMRRPGHPGNRIDVLARNATLASALRAAVASAHAGAPLPWEAAMDEVGL